MNKRCLLAFEHDLLHWQGRFRTYRIRIWHFKTGDTIHISSLMTRIEKVLNVKVRKLREWQNYLCTWHLTWKSCSILVSQKRVPRRESAQEDCVPKRRSYIPVERKNKIDKERRVDFFPKKISDRRTRDRFMEEWKLWRTMPWRYIDPIYEKLSRLFLRRV